MAQPLPPLRIRTIRHRDRQRYIPAKREHPREGTNPWSVADGGVKYHNPLPGARGYFEIFENTPLRSLQGFDILRTVFDPWGSSSVGRASRSQRGGREFESLLLHHPESASRSISSRAKRIIYFQALSDFYALFTPLSRNARECAAAFRRAHGALYSAPNERCMKEFPKQRPRISDRRTDSSQNERRTRFCDAVSRC